MKNVSTIWNKEFIMLFITNLLVLAAFTPPSPLSLFIALRSGLPALKWVLS